jgi:hypothetical protein
MRGPLLKRQADALVPGQARGSSGRKIPCSYTASSFRTITDSSYRLNAPSAVEAASIISLRGAVTLNASTTPLTAWHRCHARFQTSSRGS